MSIVFVVFVVFVKGSPVQLFLIRSWGDAQAKQGEMNLIHTELDAHYIPSLPLVNSP